MPAGSRRGTRANGLLRIAPLIEAMLADIRSARTRVWIEAYIFADDAAGRAIVKALAKRAAEGVDVRVMVDSFGSFHTPDTLFDPLRAAGGHVHWYHAFREALEGPGPFFSVLNQRNH